MESAPVSTAGAAPGDWSCPSWGVVVNLVDFLKRTRRWNRDGRVLRQLNKHWCGQLNQHVMEVRLKRSATVCPGDAAALLKFPRLTWLDASMFLKEAKGSDLATVLDVISNLSSLRRLEISISPLANLEVKTLTANGKATLTYEPGRPGVGGAKTVAQCPVEQLSCRCNIEGLLFLVKWLPSLKYLDADILRFNEPVPDLPALETLNGLESLKLHLSRTQSISFLSKITGLDSLELFQCEHIDFEVLGMLPKLKSLSMCIEEPDALYGQAFTNVLTKLTFLSLEADSTSEEIGLPSFEEKPFNLVEMSLTNIKGYSLLNDVTQLTSLSWNGAISNVGVECMASLKQLRSLCVVNAILDVWDPNAVPLNHETLPELRGLTIDVESHHLRWLEIIGKLTKLEVLGFLALGGYRIYHGDLFHLENLPKLHTLRINRVYPHEELWKAHSRLWRQLEILSININDTFNEEQIYNHLRKLSPYLKVDYIGSNRYDFVYRHHHP